MDVGRILHLDGYFTKALYLRSKTADQLEDLLGYGRGRLANGWNLLFLLELPRPAEFQFRGYSHMSGGRVQGHLESMKNGPTAEQRLEIGGYDVMSLKGKTLRDVFRLEGPQRLAKVRPVKGGNHFPPGLGVPQWQLMRPKKFLCRAFIKPGEMYLGDYA